MLSFPVVCSRDGRTARRKRILRYFRYGYAHAHCACNVKPGARRTPDTQLFGRTNDSSANSRCLGFGFFFFFMFVYFSVFLCEIDGRKKYCRAVSDECGDTEAINARTNQNRVLNDRVCHRFARAQIARFKRLSSVRPRSLRTTRLTVRFNGLGAAHSLLPDRAYKPASNDHSTLLPTTLNRKRP